MKKWYDSNARRRLEQAVLQKTGMAEAHEDNDFDLAVRGFRSTVTDANHLHDILAKHLNSTRAYLRETATVAATVNKFLKMTRLAQPSQAFEDAHNKLDQQTGEALERVFCESVLQPLEAVMEQAPGLEDMIKKHKALKLDFSYNTRKHEKEMAAMEKKKAKGKSVDMVELRSRAAKLGEAEKKLNTETAWLIEKVRIGGSRGGGGGVGVGGEMRGGERWRGEEGVREGRDGRGEGKEGNVVGEC